MLVQTYKLSILLFILTRTNSPTFQKQMIDMTRTEGSKLLFEGAHEAAVPAALQALRFRYFD